MAAIGIYGLIQHSVATRTHEIGIRIAVGARAGEIFRMVIGEGLKLSLKGRHRHRSLTFIGVSVLLVAAAAAACHFPARRAMKVDPIVALRHE